MKSQSNTFQRGVKMSHERFYTSSCSVTLDLSHLCVDRCIASQQRHSHPLLQFSTRACIRQIPYQICYSQREARRRQMAGESESSTVSIFCSAESEPAGLAACQSNRPKRDKIWRWQLLLSPFPLLLCFSPCHSITCGQAVADLPPPPSLPPSVKLEGTTSVFIPCSGKTVTIDFCCFCV